MARVSVMRENEFGPFFYMESGLRVPESVEVVAKRGFEGDLFFEAEEMAPEPHVTWTALGPDRPRVEYLKHRALYTLRINGVEVEAEEKVWQELKRSLIELYGVYTPPENG